MQMLQWIILRRRDHMMTYQRKLILCSKNGFENCPFFLLSKILMLKVNKKYSTLMSMSSWNSKAFEVHVEMLQTEFYKLSLIKNLYLGYNKLIRTQSLIESEVVCRHTLNCDMYCEILSSGLLKNHWLLKKRYKALNMKREIQAPLTQVLSWDNI